MTKLVKRYQVELVLVCLLITGFITFASHIDMPIVRNAAVYARIAERIDLAGDNFNASQHAFNKSLGFAYLSIPWTRLFGLNMGMQFSGLFIAAIWIMLLVPVYRRLSLVFGAPDGMLSWYLLITALNPLVYYQFVAGYPDLLFAVSFLCGIYFLDRFLSEEVRWYDSILVGIAFLFSVWVKHNGFIFLPILILFMIFRFSTVKWMYQERRKELVLGVFSITAFILIIAMAKAGYDFELFNLRTTTKNYTQGNDTLGIFYTNSTFFFAYLVLCFSCFIPFVIPIKNWSKCKVWYLCIIIFLVSLLYYRGTRLNIRYFLALSPFFAMIIVANLQLLPKVIRHTMLGVFLGINIFTIAYYNSLPFNNWASKLISLPQFDNLRLVNGQKEAFEAVNLINRIQKENDFSHIIFLSNYYNTGLWHTWEQSGLFNQGVEVIYATWWKDSLWDRCQCDEAVVYDYRGRSFERIQDTDGSNIFTQFAKEVFVVKKPSVSHQ